MLHQGVRVGHVFMGGKEKGEDFSQEDQETLVNTSPVGMVVFDAKTGMPVSVSREAMRVVAGPLDEGQGWRTSWNW